MIISKLQSIPQLDPHLAGHKGYVAGGVFNRIFRGEQIRDIDLFFNGQYDWSEAVNYYNHHDDYKTTYSTSNAIGFIQLSTDLTIECVSSIFGTPKEVLRAFDFTICKYAYDGSNVYEHQDFWEHLYRRQLVIDEGMRAPESTFLRMFKYLDRGFSLESKEKLLSVLVGHEIVIRGGYK